MDSFGVGIGLFVMAASLFAYFLPALVANHRKHPQGNAIFLLNLLLGWTLLGWIAALVWSATAVERRE